MPSQLLWGINLSFERLSPCKRQIIYVLRTRAPVASDIATLLPLDFHGLTGGVYKARERIHRAIADARLLANPASWGRVADPNPN